MPETAGLTLEQIENIWQSEKHPDCVIRRDPGAELRRLSTVAVSPAIGLTRVLTGPRIRRRTTTEVSPVIQEEEEKVAKKYLTAS